MDKSTQELPRHPLGAGLGLGSRDKLAVSGVNNSFNSILVYSHRRSPTQQTSKLAHMHPTCPLGDAVCLGALGEPISGENVHTLVFWGHGSGNWDVKGLTISRSAVMVTGGVNISGP